MTSPDSPSPRRAHWIAANLGLPWTWRVRVVGARLLATGPMLVCGHRSVSTKVLGDDLVYTTSRLARAVRFHLGGG